MYARVATFEGGDTKRILELNRESMDNGTMNGPEGIKRVALLDDPASGRRLFISYFDTKEEVDAAEARFESMGDEIPEEIRGRRTNVTVYEVTFDQEL